MNHQPSPLPAPAPAPAPAPSEITRRPRRWRYVAGAVLCVMLVLAGLAGFFLTHPDRAPDALDRVIEDATGANPHPVTLLRPAAQPLSALALLGQQIFNDPSLSASGRQSCASCHSPERSFGPPNDRDVQIGGPTMNIEGVRPPPSLAYLYRQGPFAIGPVAGETDTVIPLDQLAQQAQGAPRASKSAGISPAAAAMVPSGGLFWDGRDDTLMGQAKGPMMNPAEMANSSMDAVAAKLARARYAAQFTPLFGQAVLKNPAMLFTEAMSALSRYQIEATAFHRFDSKYDHWL